MPYALNIVSNSKKTLVRTIQNDYTTDDDLSITERCDKSIQHSSLVWQTGAIVDTATHSTHSSLVVSQTNASLDNTNEHLLHLHIHIVKLDVHKLCHKVTKKYPPTRHLTSLRLNSLRRTNNNKHNDTVNLHAQNCCTQKLHNQTHPKISQNVYKSKRNLVANDVYVSHTVIIIADQPNP